MAVSCLVNSNGGSVEEDGQSFPESSELVGKRRVLVIQSTPFVNAAIQRAAAPESAAPRPADKPSAARHSSARRRCSSRRFHGSEQVELLASPYNTSLEKRRSIPAAQVGRGRIPTSSTRVRPQVPKPRPRSNPKFLFLGIQASLGTQAAVNRGGLVVELGLKATDAVAELVLVAVAVQCGQLLAQPLP